MNVCTIIAKNYAAHARVLAGSLLTHDPPARIWALVIDDIDGYIDPAQEPFEVLTPRDIGCEPFQEMAARYSVRELSTAVKPWLLGHVLSMTGNPVTYLDPDIKVYSSLRRLDELAGAHGVVLAPHTSVPVPSDGRKPSQADILVAGVYNLGYLSLAPGAEVEALLDWWRDRLRRDRRVDPVWGYFVDQRWFDPVPGFLTDFAMLRDSEYDVAYWNLPSRRLDHDGSRYLVDGRPLAFFHFSGFDPRHRLVLSRHQNRIDVPSQPVLERLLAEYADEVAAAGHDRSRRWPYSFDRPGQDTSGAGLRPVQGEAAAPLLDETWGVNVVGYFRSELGTGAAARLVVRALDSTEIPALPVHGKTVPLNRQGHTYETSSPQDAVYPVNLICMNADALPEFAGQVGESFFAGRYSIGLWFWEISSFLQRWQDSFSLVEEVWAPTAHVAGALAALATVPVHTVRLPVQLPTLPERSRAELGLPEDDFLFLFGFDYLSIFARKNPLAVLDAFRGAVAGRALGARLVLKCINQDHDPEAHRQLVEAIAGDPAIVLIDRYLAPEDNIRLSQVCDCYVSLHRAEGFGLGMAEAMWHAKPVIATGYSGNLDFMSASNSLLVDYELVPIGAGAEPYPPEAMWAAPDVEHAARLMRQVLDDPHAARELGRRAGQEIRRTHSPAAAGEIMYRRLEAIRGTWTPRRAASRLATAPRVARAPERLVDLPAKVRRGPPATARRPGAARRQLRNATLRAMRPFTVYQQSVNQELAAAVHELSAALVTQRRETAAELATLRAELRQERARQETGRWY
ncbi:MAG: glycosyltransferase family 4 protein [Actinomycetota bacterium]|nr:glycosyltransferase family 4 protein [Actinomycetota bacterium]